MTQTTNKQAAETAKNREIYNKLADIAREVFNHMTAEPGKVYTPADIAAAITGGPVTWEREKGAYQLERVEPYALGAGLTWAEGYDPATVYEVAAGSFACKVNGWKVWAVLNNAARAWSIPTRDRVTFKKNDREAVPVVASFTLTATEARELLAATAADELRPVLCGVHLDTRRRVLVASDGYIMRVVNLGDRLTATAAAAPSYNIHKSVIKAGRAVTIYADELAEAAGVAVKCYAANFPNWAAVLNGYNYSEAGRVALTPTQFKDLKKAVAEVAKVHHAGKWHPLRVTIAHTAGESVAHIWARDIDFDTERESAVNIDPAAPSFSIDTDARRLAKVTTAAALYVIDPAAALLMTDPAGLTMIMPLQPSEDDKYFSPFTVAPAGGRPDLLPGVDIAAAAAEITHAHRLASAAEILKNNADATADELAALVVSCSGHVLTDSEARDLLAEARELMTAAPAADDSQDTTTTPAEVISESEDTTPAPAADDSEDTPAAAFEWSPELRAAAEAIAAGYMKNDPESDRAAYTARRLLRTAGLTVAAERIETADGLAVAKIVLTYGKKRRDLSRPITAARVEFIENENTTTAEPVSEPTAAAPAADDSEDTTTTPAEVISEPTAAAPAADDSEADALPVTYYDPAAGVIVWGLADELPTTDGLTADTVTPADLLTIEAEHAESERERADHADALTIATADSQTADTDRAERRPLLLTIARHALRLAAAAALLLLLTIAPDRAADTLAAPADLTATPAPADVLTITPDTLTAAAPAADSLEAESRAELADPADSPRPTAERRHAPANKREGHARALLTVEADTLTADTLAAAPLLLAADSIEADTLAAQIATLEQAQEITAPADTLAAGSTLEPAQEITGTPTDDTDSEADTITTDDEPTDTDPATADSESDSTPTDTATNGHPHAHGSTPATMATPCSPSAPLAPVAPILI